MNEQRVEELPKPPRSLAGYATSIIAALPTALYAGIGGALVSAVAGAVSSAVVNVVFGRVTASTLRMAGGEQQIEGVLDSSQLDDPSTIPSPSALALRQRVVSIAVSLAATLGASALVSMATGGVGINFYLGNPFGQAEQAQQAAPQKAADGDFEKDVADALPYEDLSVSDEVTDAVEDAASTTDAALGDSSESDGQDQNSNAGVDSPSANGSADDNASSSARDQDSTAAADGQDAASSSAPEQDPTNA